MDDRGITSGSFFFLASAGISLFGNALSDQKWKLTLRVASAVFFNLAMFIFFKPEICTYPLVAIPIFVAVSLYSFASFWRGRLWGSKINSTSLIDPLRLKPRLVSLKQHGPMLTEGPLDSPYFGAFEIIVSQSIADHLKHIVAEVSFGKARWYSENPVRYEPSVRQLDKHKEAILAVCLVDVEKKYWLETEFPITSKSATTTGESSGISTLALGYRSLTHSTDPLRVTLSGEIASGQSFRQTSVFYLNEKGQPALLEST